jgi:hypothetical protein
MFIFILFFLFEHNNKLNWQAISISVYFCGKFLHHGDKKNGCANATKEIWMIKSSLCDHECMF